MIISIDTSTDMCSAALHDAGTIVADISLQKGKSHAEMLNMMINNLLSEGKIEINQVSAIAISSGPGSYTGLRIASSTAKGLCYALDIPLIAVPSLTIIASQAILYGAAIYAMIDARRMEVYCQKFDNRLSEITEIRAKVLDVNEIYSELEHEKIVFCGNGSDKLRPLISHANAIFAKDVHPSATHMGTLAYTKFQKNEFEDVYTFEPYYLKNFVAAFPKNVLNK
ncbi:MAG: tRNA (adenosine(37)-N6)-threonylcarbamoyltransferase complex dimerization subunit type 1 TsaB [Cytophagales bacterium]|nr:tRNA (adenosine(37)-N6)-threonylcarbamoyltransferase complex dimerization subunit type 1 TsaB [Cytophagales bacterium]